MKAIADMQNFKSRKEWEEYVWKKIVADLAEIDSSQRIDQFLNMLLTAHEKKQVINRASAISLLKQGKSYSQVGEILWLSPNTISAIRKSMRGQKEYMSRYMRNKKLEKKQKPLSKEELDQLLFTAKVSAFFTLPPPPLPHPRLSRLLGIDDQFSRKQRYK